MDIFSTRALVMVNTFSPQNKLTRCAMKKWNGVRWKIQKSLFQRECWMADDDWVVCLHKKSIDLETFNSSFRAFYQQGKRISSGALSWKLWKNLARKSERFSDRNIFVSSNSPTSSEDAEKFFRFKWKLVWGCQMSNESSCLSFCLLHFPLIFMNYSRTLSWESRSFFFFM